jgi:GNAT superfamily N-acetyltransferase
MKESSMSELKNGRGAICARIDPVRKGDVWVLLVSWHKGAGGIPDKSAWAKAMETAMAECVKNNARFIESRVIASGVYVDTETAAARAALHRDFLAACGFRKGESRVEYRMDLEEALEALESRKIVPTLSWKCVDAGNAIELARAADLFRLAGEGDPAGHPEDDTLEFLKGFLNEEGTIVSPERLQIGMCGGKPAAVLALMSFPSDGWCTVYYLGVLPAFRGRGFGREAMLRALRSLKTMGGKTYQDGTGESNAAARALLGLLGTPPFRVMEEWRLDRRQDPMEKGKRS